jgi:hypothetical protein
VLSAKYGQKVQLRQFEAAPSIDFLYSRSYIINQDGKRLGEYNTDSNSEKDKLSALFVHDFIPMLTLIVRKESFIKVGYFFLEGYSGTADFELKMRLTKYCSIGFCDEPLAGYRVHSSNQLSSKREHRESILKLSYDLLQRYPELEGVKNKCLSKVHKIYGIYCFDHNELDEARSHFENSIKMQPLQVVSYLFLFMAWPVLRNIFNIFRVCRRSLINLFKTI